MSILIVTPSFKILGGVANHYMGLAPYWNIKVTYCFYGKRKRIPAILCFVPDILMFSYLLLTKKFDCVVINPSLRLYQLRRDAIYLLIAKLFRKNVVTFIHGFDEKLATEFSKNKKGLFQRIYNKSTFIYVLYSGFKEMLKVAGITVPIKLTTTKVADFYLNEFDINRRQGKIENILFLARINKEKGIYITIDAFNILKSSFPNLRLTICGDGPELDKSKEYVKKLNLTNVLFKGHVSGEDVIDVFKSSDLYILPTTHHEGMATSVLEAMAFGLPILSRPVGGINDFFIDGEMGYLLDSLDANDYAVKIIELINNPALTLRMSQTNNEFAKQQFMASKVAVRFESDLANIKH